MSKITTFNSAVSNAINKENADYVAIVGEEGFIPEPTIVTSDDFNCGAYCNELEYLKVVTDYYYMSFDLDIAETENLDELITAFISMPRRNQGESDLVYRNRFRSIVNQNVNIRRTTRWAILDALTYFLADVSTQAQVIEVFQVADTYFELRIEGAVDYTESIFLNNFDQSYLNQNYVGGSGVGVVISYLGEIIDRIKAAGVDYDIIFIAQDRFTKTVDAFIGTIQIYKSVDAIILNVVPTNKPIDATIV